MPRRPTHVWFHACLPLVVVLLMTPACASSADRAEPETPATAETATTAEAAADAPDCAPDDEMCRVEALGEDTLGELTLGLDEAGVVAALGEPDSRSEPILQEADGMVVSDWVWARDGVQLTMSAPAADAAATVSGIVVTAPSTLATSRGIAIGSAEAEVTEAYAGLADPAFTKPGASFVAGSVYGGTFFTFEGGKVTQIFIGAGAE